MAAAGGCDVGERLELGLVGMNLWRSDLRFGTMSNKQLCQVLKEWDADREGVEMHQTVAALYPICRSITGEGVRESLRLLQKQVPLALREVPSGTQVFDWLVPKEWNIRDAYIKNSRNERVIDFQKCNLHVVNYSIPVKQKMRLSELREHLFTLPETPDWVPLPPPRIIRRPGVFALARIRSKNLQTKNMRYA